MKRLYNSEMNSTYFCSAGLKEMQKTSLHIVFWLDRTQSLKSWKSLTKYFLDPRLPTKQTPLITTTSPGNYENPRELIRCRKVSIWKSTDRNLLWPCNFVRFPGPSGRDRNPCEVPFHWAISRPCFSNFRILKFLESKMALKFVFSSFKFWPSEKF